MTRRAGSRRTPPTPLRLRLERAPLCRIRAGASAAHGRNLWRHRSRYASRRMGVGSRCRVLCRELGSLDRLHPAGYPGCAKDPCRALGHCCRRSRNASATWILAACRQVAEAGRKTLRKRNDDQPVVERLPCASLSTPALRMRTARRPKTESKFAKSLATPVLIQLPVSGCSSERPTHCPTASRA